MEFISKSDMKRMLHHCYFKNITTGGEPYFGNKDNLEVHHDGIHDWVGGDMGIIKFSSFDPIFWMHHAFIDYIWEDFREKQSSSECNVDVETDYSETDLSQHKALGHAATDPLHGFEYLQIKDGLWKNWTTKFANYEPQLKCPACGNSQFMYCDLEIDKERHPNGVCVSKDYNACHSVQEVDKESHSVIERFDPEAFPGIGRTRGNADGENFKLLQQEIERETQGNKTSSIKMEDDGKVSAARKTFGIIVIFIGIICLLCTIVYCLYKRNIGFRILVEDVRKSRRPRKLKA